MPDTEVAPDEAGSLHRPDCSPDCSDHHRMTNDGFHTEVAQQVACSVCGSHDALFYHQSRNEEGQNNYLCDDHCIVCDDCSSWAAMPTGICPDDWRLAAHGEICPSCADNYGSCDACGDMLPFDNLFAYRGDNYCLEHLPSDDEEDDGNDDRSETVINEYHSSRHLVQRVPSPWTRSHDRYIGVELEVEQIHGSRNETARAILDSVANVVAQITTDKHTSFRLLCAEHDGSLNNGYELVTAPLGLDDHHRLWTHILTSSNIKGLRSHNTTTCGLHVHISRNKLTQLQIAKVVAFVNSSSNYAFMKRLARRYGTHYCKAKSIPLCNGAKNLDQDRYEMVNLCNSHTIEFRIFRGTLKLESLLACVEFANALVAYADCSSGAGMDITAARFRRFIAEPGMRADTVYLRSYLASVVPATDTE